MSDAMADGDNTAAGRHERRLTAAEPRQQRRGARPSPAYEVQNYLCWVCRPDARSTPRAVTASMIALCFEGDLAFAIGAVHPRACPGRR